MDTARAKQHSGTSAAFLEAQWQRPFGSAKLRGSRSWGLRPFGSSMLPQGGLVGCGPREGSAFDWLSQYFGFGESACSGLPSCTGHPQRSAGRINPSDQLHRLHLRLHCPHCLRCHHHCTSLQGRWVSEHEWGHQASGRNEARALRELCWLKELGFGEIKPAVAEGGFPNAMLGSERSWGQLGSQGLHPVAVLLWRAEHTEETHHACGLGPPWGKNRR